MKWIELITSMECNCGCQVCPRTHVNRGESMDLPRMKAWLEEAAREGARSLWFGGGEPTLHPDLVQAVEFARRLEYETILVQTNGIRLAYRPYVERLVQAGVNKFSLSIKGVDANSHDSITRRPGAFELLRQGLENLVELEVQTRADVLITTELLPSLPAIVERFSGRGVAEYLFWLVSMHGLPASARTHLPPMGAVVSSLVLAFEQAERYEVRARSLHTPPCVLPDRFRDRYLPSNVWDLVVILPDGRRFRAEQSPMEGGTYLAACAGCSARERCLGLRADYLEVHGPAGFDPLA